LLVNHVNLLACIPDAWLGTAPRDEGLALIAVFGTKEHLERLLALYPKMLSDFPCSLTKPDLFRAGWISCCFDLVDLTLSTSWQVCGNVSGPKPTPGKGPQYATLNAALADIATANQQVPEHAPFTPVEIISSQTA
jgi:hypothetical protein